MATRIMRGSELNPFSRAVAPVSTAVVALGSFILEATSGGSFVESLAAGALSGGIAGGITLVATRVEEIPSH